MRNRFDQQLETLNAELITMGALCEEAVMYAMQALFKGDMDMAEKAFEAERQIDQKEREIENLCMRLLLQQQPVAGDLRVISSALKMISDMERIGDHAEDIAEIAGYIEEGEGIPQEDNLQMMARAASSMVTESVDSFVKKDLELAEKVIGDDNIVDGYFDKVKSDLIVMISEEPGKGQLYLDLLMVAKYLERIADHTTNIGEWVAYSITGQHPDDKPAEKSEEKN